MNKQPNKQPRKPHVYLNKADKAFAKKLFATGYDEAEIARKFDVSTKTVDRILKAEPQKDNNGQE